MTARGFGLSEKCEHGIPIFGPPCADCEGRAWHESQNLPEPTQPERDRLRAAAQAVVRQYEFEGVCGVSGHVMRELRAALALPVVVADKQEQEGVGR